MFAKKLVLMHENVMILVEQDNGCPNLSLGFVTKTRACEVATQEESLGTTSHALRNVKECED
jgi:hypothetical protein